MPVRPGQYADMQTGPGGRTHRRPLEQPTPATHPCSLLRGRSLLWLRPAPGRLCLVALYLQLPPGKRRALQHTHQVVVRRGCQHQATPLRSSAGMGEEWDPYPWDPGAHFMRHSGVQKKGHNMRPPSLHAGCHAPLRDVASQEDSQRVSYNARGHSMSDSPAWCWMTRVCRFQQCIRCFS